MNSRKFLLVALILVALAQLFVPAKMILDKEKVLASGKEFRFKTAPIDPNDPFRGRFITLGFEENRFNVGNAKEWVENEIIYVSFSTDNDGFAKIKSVSKEPPTDSQDFIKARVGFVFNDGSNNLTIDYPFSRYYMEESKASGAEQRYRQSNLDTIHITYALVSIRRGDAALKDVIINGVSLRKAGK